MVLYLVLGTIFGFVLSRSGAADYNYIQGMFLFERFQTRDLSPGASLRAFKANRPAIEKLARVQIELGRLADDVEFSTVNGGITVAITGDVDATLRAATMNGSIESDFPVTIQGKAGRRSLQGTLGKGGPRIDLESVNGSLRLRRAGSSGTTSQ